LTLIAGVVVFIVGQVFVVLFLERIRLQARTIEAIAQALVIYARDYANPVQSIEDLPEEWKRRLTEGSTELRRLAAVLRSTAETLRWYRFFERVRLVLLRRSVIEASKCLIGLSNCMPPRNDRQMMTATKFQDEISNLLNIGD
jgi:hypothetical protein